jgi:hypothetical protein
MSHLVPDTLTSGGHCESSVYEFAFTTLTFTTTLMFYVPGILVVALHGYEFLKDFVSDQRDVSIRWKWFKDVLKEFKDQLLAKVKAVYF